MSIESSSAAAGRLLEPRTAEALAAIKHGFFTRNGGVSEGIYASLNAGTGSNDDPAHVAENRARIAAWFALAPERLTGVHQVHSAQAVFVEDPWQAERPEADALVTKTPNLALSILTADCAPVLFADQSAGVIAAAHAGWKGALHGVLENTLDLMVEHGATRENISAAIGPCIQQASYEVGPEFRDAFGDERFFKSGQKSDQKSGQSDRLHFDLSGYCAYRLKQAGAPRVEILPDDTCADEARYFSNRRRNQRGEPDYGRNLSAIMLGVK